MDLDNPLSFNEKILLMNLSGYFERYSHLVDKYEVRKYVEKKVGGRILTKLYGVYDHESQIDFCVFPQKFVLKATHGSHWNILCPNKTTFDEDAARKRFGEWLGMNYYKLHRERLYKAIPPMIISEQFIEHDDVKDQLIYEIFCFDGRVEFTQVVYNRFTKCEDNFLTGIYYDRNWKICPFKDRVFSSKTIDRPGNYNKMVEIAETLAEDKPFVRVDLYSIKDQILFGELTFMPAAGYWKFIAPEWDYVVGNMLHLPAEIEKSKIV